MFDALRCQSFWADGGIEHFDRNPLVVTASDEFGGDGWEIDIAHAGTSEVGIVGVKVRGPG